ncbi:hypothetical protein O9H85_07860 [Paenibacillus filicis]|uniref:Uncharacterized protein n=1 Tax=Paenibacillus gyeongsangnamensis TaxID=3388067 RepID=A0ABT4Q6C3_9BACL|nr:hypothetical protein [Paenibacillus filicis]MCZ8512346.1 hypothetical protein [Paenibacillus filicis]
MMIGSIRINIVVGAAAFVITFILSISHNIWVTTLLRSFYSFLLSFVIVFGCRWVLGSVAGLKPFPADPGNSAADESHKGNSFDATTPDEEADLHQMLKPGAATGENVGLAEFAPLNPPKLSTKLAAGPDELTQAVRRMTEE